MNERFDDLAFVIGFILAKHIPMLRKRSRRYSGQEDWAIRDEIAKEIANKIRAGWHLEKHPPAKGFDFDTGPFMAASRRRENGET
jgi:hypothetical protein